MKSSLFSRIIWSVVVLTLLGGECGASLVVNNDTKTQQTQSYRDCINSCTKEFQGTPLMRTCFDNCIHRPLQF